MPSLLETYKTSVIPAIKKSAGYAHALAVPRIKKVVVNVGTGRFLREKGSDEEVVTYITAITGQKPLPCPARQSIASFKIRQGQVVGYKVTLRGKRMYDFLDRFISSAVPRVRDFRGFDASAVDGNGNLTVGIREHSVFPETIGEDVRSLFGLEVTVVTDAKSKKEALELFRLLGFPLKKELGN